MTGKPIMIIGGAYGPTETLRQASFSGPSGGWLSRWLKACGLPGAVKRKDNRGEYFDWADNPLIHVTDVLKLQASNGDPRALCGDKATAIPHLPALAPKRYLPQSLAPELARLDAEIAAHSPSLIVGLGPTALLYLSHTTPKLKTNRGYPFTSVHNIPALCSYHPLDVIRDWSLRPILMKDLDKVSRIYTNPVRPSRKIWLSPTISDLTEFERLYFADPYNPMGIDIETKTLGHLHIITEIGFAPDPEHAIVVPFFHPDAEDGNYWTHSDEILAMRWCKRILQWTRCPVFQNGMYDIAWIWRTWGFPVTYANEDTMLLAHSIQPELPKSLGFLGSIYTNEPTWKLMRKDVAQKKEDM